MNWFGKNRHLAPGVKLEGENLDIRPIGRELTGIEKMEIERKLAERKATELRDAKLRQIIAAKRAAIQPQLDEIQRLEQELSPRAWIFQNAYGQQQNIGMGNYGALSLLMGAIGGGKC